MITFTLDLEDHRKNNNDKKRYPKITHEILSLLESLEIKGTFFVVGKIVKESPELIKAIADNGHELAFHSYAHKQLQYETCEGFKEETSYGKSLLEDVTGQEVIGFRAPVFSLIETTLWVTDVLKELGFLYSSSVMPAKNPLNGFCNAPDIPFVWPNGLIEIPVPVSKLGPITIPYLGGVYLRYLPRFLVKQMIEKSGSKHLWTYCHPYDFDHTEPFTRIEGASLLTSVILWFNRKHMQQKLEYLLTLKKGSNEPLTFSEQFYQGWFDQVPEFNFSKDFQELKNKKHQ